MQFGIITQYQKLFWPQFWNGIIVLKCYFSNVNLFMFSYFGPNFIKKFLWGIIIIIINIIIINNNNNNNNNNIIIIIIFFFFQILAKIRWRKMKIGYLAAILKRYNLFFFFFFFKIMISYNGANIIAKFRWESGFLGEGGPWKHPPWAPTGVKVPWSLKCYVWRLIDSFYCTSQNFPERCENSFCGLQNKLRKALYPLH